MVLFHISGTSASGKTFTGDILRRIYPDTRLHVVDLDNIFREAIENTEHKSAEARFQQIQKRVHAHVARLRARYPNVLLTGYSDIVLDGKVRYVELGAEYKYFIDIPTDQLISQYRSRASQYVLETTGETRTLSNAALKKMVADDRRIYKGFRRIPQLQIIKEIILILK